MAHGTILGIRENNGIYGRGDVVSGLRARVGLLKEESEIVGQLLVAGELLS